jgi:folylpolyglutamate synthase
MLMSYRSTANQPLKIGCLTSPHVTNICERIRLDASPVSEELFARYFFEMWGKMECQADCPDPRPSFPGYPGFLALLGMYMLVKENVDVAIIETGVGGENDSTNVIPSPIATGITSIGMDHVKVLGNDLGSIAWHKAGIFKQGSRAYTVEQDDLVLDVLRKRAQEKKTLGPLDVVSERLVSDYEITVSPDMSFQRKNAALAITLVESCLKVIRPGFTMTRELAKSMEATELQGKTQIIRTGKLAWYISSAHNDISVEVASQWYSSEVKKDAE